MTAHELAKLLAAGPDVPVAIIGSGDADGFTVEVDQIRLREQDTIGKIIQVIEITSNQEPFCFRRFK